MFILLKISRAHTKVTSKSQRWHFGFVCCHLVSLSFFFTAGGFPSFDSQWWHFAFRKFRLPVLFISEQGSNHFIGACLNTTCGMEICQSTMRPKEGEGVGGCLSITEMESDMSCYEGGSRSAVQSFFKVQYGSRWIGVGKVTGEVVLDVLGKDEEKKQKEKVRGDAGEGRRWVTKEMIWNEEEGKMRNREIGRGEQRCRRTGEGKWWEQGGKDDEKRRKMRGEKQAKLLKVTRANKRWGKGSKRVILGRKEERGISEVERSRKGGTMKCEQTCTKRLIFCCLDQLTVWTLHSCSSTFPHLFSEPTTAFSNWFYSL